MAEPPTITVEFFGIPRSRAKQAGIDVVALTVADALREVARLCPGLSDMLTDNAFLAAPYLVSINAQRFVNNLGDPLAAGDRLLIFSRDAGG